LLTEYKSKDRHTDISMVSKARGRKKTQGSPDPLGITRSMLSAGKVNHPVVDLGTSGTTEMGFVQDASAGIEKRNKNACIGGAIRTLRKEKGMSQAKLAKNASVNRTTIARVECGIFKSLALESLEKIAIAIGIDLKTLLIKAESIAGESLNYRGNLNRVVFTLEYPEDGFRFVSFIPKKKEFFFGKIEIQPQKTVGSSKLPHPEQIYLHFLEGKALLVHERQESLLKAGDCFAFSGRSDYELYNPDQFKGCSALFITYPSFLLV